MENRGFLLIFYWFLWIFTNYDKYATGNRKHYSWRLWTYAIVDFHGFSWIFMDFSGFLWIFMDFHQLWQISTGNRKHSLTEESDKIKYPYVFKPRTSTFRATLRVLLERSHLREASGPNESSRGPYLVVVFWPWDKRQKSDTCQPATVGTQFATTSWKSIEINENP